jgi:hypothetical protein
MMLASVEVPTLPGALKTLVVCSALELAVSASFATPRACISCGDSSLLPTIRALIEHKAHFLLHGDVPVKQFAGM